MWLRFGKATALDLTSYLIYHSQRFICFGVIAFKNHQEAIFGRHVMCFFFMLFTTFLLDFISISKIFKYFPLCVLYISLARSELGSCQTRTLGSKCFTSLVVWGNCTPKDIWCRQSVGQFGLVCDRNDYVVSLCYGDVTMLALMMCMLDHMLKALQMISHYSI